MCSWNAFIQETGKQLDPIYEKVLMNANEYTDCSNACMESLEKHGFLCRSFMFDEAGQTCILYDEDPLSYEELAPADAAHSVRLKSRPLISSTGNLFRVLCVTDDKGRSYIYPIPVTNRPNSQCHLHIYIHSPKNQSVFVES